MPAASTLKNTVLMLLAGASATLSFAPFNWPLFSVISLLGAYLLLLRASNGWWSGWAYGSGFFGAGVSWVYVSIHFHGGMSGFAAAALTAIFCVGLGLLFALQFLIYRRLFNRPNPVGFAALWIGFEWLRSWLLTGFPWLYLGYAWIDTPLATLAPIGGVWLVSTAVVVISMLLADALLRRKTIPLIAATFLFLGASLLPKATLDKSDSVIPIALIQPNISQSLKWQQSHFDAHIEQLGQLSRTAPEAAWIIWPETAIPRLINNSFDVLAPWLEEFESRHQILVSGFPRREWREDTQRWVYLNSIGTLTGVASVYDKQRLVPFGEYIPLENWLRGAIEFFNLPMSSFSLPHRTGQGLQIGDELVSAAICYEIAYPELVRQQTAAGATLLLTVSNDTWFEGSHAPAQHLQIARMRALENHRWLIRATNNGLTAIIDPLGRVAAQVPDKSAQVLQAKVWPSGKETLYQRFGAYPTLAIWLIILLGSLIRALIHARRQRAFEH